MTPDHLTPLERRLLECLQFIYNDGEGREVFPATGLSPGSSAWGLLMKALVAAQAPQSVEEKAEWLPDNGDWFEVQYNRWATDESWEGPFRAVATKDGFSRLAEAYGYKYRPAQKEGGGE